MTLLDFIKSRKHPNYQAYRRICLYFQIAGKVYMPIVKTCQLDKEAPAVQEGSVEIKSHLGRL